MTEYTFSHKKNRAALGIAGVFALTLLTAVPNPVRAQQTAAATTSGQESPRGTSVRQAVNQFANAYGTPIIQRGGINGSAQAALTLGNDGSATTREADIASLANSAGASWHRMFFIAPAASDKPVTTYVQAKNLTTDAGRISLQIKRLPFEAAARAFASAAHSEVTMTDGTDTQAGGMVTIPAANLTAAQIIARLAAQTKTHWTVGYVLQPMTADELAMARQARNASSPVTAVSDASASSQSTASDMNAQYTYAPYQGNDLNGNPYAQVANQIPDGYDRYGNPYFLATQGGDYGGSALSSYVQNPYAMNGATQGGYSGYYGDPTYGMGGFTTTSPTYYGYGYGPGMNPYAAGVTQNAIPFTNGSGLPFGFDPYNTTVFSSGGVGSGTGSETLTP